jgi:hypothetical protein
MVCVLLVSHDLTEARRESVDSFIEANTGIQSIDWLHNLITLRVCWS